MKKNLKKISLKKTTLMVLTGKEKQQAAGGGFTNGCGSFTLSAPWRCMLSAGPDC
jgi:hypothetical protein